MASAKTDYCKFSELKYDVHVFQNSYFLDSEKSKLESGFNNIYNKLRLGDEFNVIFHTANGQKKWSRCLPGCPKTTFLEGLTSDCSVEVAKKQLKQFRSQLTGLIVSAVNAERLSFDVLADIKALQEFYEGRDYDEDSSFVFHTTIPYSTDLDDRLTFDTAFVKLTQQHNLSKITMPSVRFVNANRSTNVSDFWSDLKLNGHSDGLKIKFSHITLD